MTRITARVSAVVVVLLVAAAAPVGASARPAHPVATSGGSGGPAGPSRPAVVPSSPVLYSQYDNQSTGDLTSQDFESGMDIYDGQLADDFVVPVGQTWRITGVDVDGEYSTSGPPASMNVFFYRNGGGLPGTVFATRLANSFSGGTNPGDFVITLTSPVTFSPGTYWISVQARMDFSSGGQWYWRLRTVQSNSADAWENPGNGFGTGCTTWTHPTSCGVATDPDAVFQLHGTSTGC